MRCEKCGQELNEVLVDMFTRYGDDDYIPHPIFETDENEAFVDFASNWTGYDLSEEEQHETIKCPHCGEYPFIKTEVQVHEIVRLVIFKDRPWRYQGVGGKDMSTVDNGSWWLRRPPPPTENRISDGSPDPYWWMRHPTSYYGDPHHKEESMENSNTEKRPFSVEITETLKLTITVEAESVADAEELAEEMWNKELYVLGSEHFVGASFHGKEVADDL